MILTQSQAKAIYSAMCALNTVDADVAQYNLPERKQVSAFADGTFGVSLAGRTKEEYPSQAAFAAAYGLISDDWQSDVAAAAGGLTQTAIER